MMNGRNQNNDKTSDNEKMMEISLKFVLEEDGGAVLAQGDGKAVLNEEDLSVMPKYGEALYFELRDIEQMVEDDFRLNLVFTGQEKLTLYHLGHSFQGFAAMLSRLRHELMIKDLLMYESVRRKGLKAHCSIKKQDGIQVCDGKGELRFYETSLVILPEHGEPFRVPYGSIDRIDDFDYTVRLITEYGEELVFSKMGQDYEPFTSNLSKFMNEMSVKAQSSIKQLLPQITPAIIRKAARLMREGKAVRRSDLEAISPELWTQLEKRLEEVGIKEEYDFLSSMAQTHKSCIGMKQGLLGDETGEYLWFLIPIYHDDHKRPGNAIAMEAVSGQGGGKATYFFRITGRQDYSKYETLDELHMVTDEVLTNINRCMLAINFRREPVYLSDDKLDEPSYKKYKRAVNKIPELRELRRLFIGRVFHRNPGQWKKDVENLLEFNVQAAKDELFWNSSSDESEEKGG